MLNKLIHILKEYNGIEYQILEKKNYGPERYYIKRQLEMDRYVDVNQIFLTIYKTFNEDGNTYCGSSQVEIHPTFSKEEIISAIDEASYAAGFVKNEYYPLVEPDDNKVPSASVTTDNDLTETINKAHSIVYKKDHYEKGCLSYTEFFVKHTNCRIINSKGLDLHFAMDRTYVETAVTWKEENEIEIFESYTMAGCDENLLENGIANLFTIASQKPHAEPTPDVNDINILLSGESLQTFFSYYYNNAGAANVYAKQSTFKIGDDLQDNATGDRITMVLDPELPFSSCSRPYDEDGFPLKKTEIISEGKLIKYWGSLRFSTYLNVPPTGSIMNYWVSGGTHSIESMKKEPYLELVSFSDFSMDSTTGDFASEIRLGFYFNGETTVPITGGAISGNITNVHKDMKMSVETSQYDYYHGPSMISIRNVSIASAMK